MQPNENLVTESPVKSARRIVVKVGSSLVTNDGKGLDRAAISQWAEQIAQLRKMGKEVVLVSSGAVAEGMQRLGLDTRPVLMNLLQACAAVGQMGLVQMYETCFRAQGLGTAQILLTHADLADRTRYLNARATLTCLLQMGVVPIINENDTVVTDEIKVGDNDTMGALVANLIDADCLVILTDQSGLFTADPRSHPEARLIQTARAGEERLEAMAGGAGSSFSKGGMITKVLAAKRAAASGAHTVIASGRETQTLVRLAAGELIGTALLASTPRLAARKQWLADHLQTRGRIVLDAGAARALTAQGTSLLPVGVLEVQGDFMRGEVVSCVDAKGVEIARGMVNYPASETRLIMRKPSSEIAALLGYSAEEELIHRDNLVLVQAR
jgi:glutamate 5-kinase